MAPHPWKCAIVVGASSGIGEHVARRLAAGGTAVALVARRQAELDTVAGSIASGAPGRRAVVRAHDVADGAVGSPGTELEFAL